MCEQWATDGHGQVMPCMMVLRTPQAVRNQLVKPDLVRSLARRTQSFPNEVWMRGQYLLRVHT